MFYSKRNGTTSISYQFNYVLIRFYVVFRWANTGPIWGRKDPSGPHIGPMNLVIWNMFDKKYSKFERNAYTVAFLFKWAGMVMYKKTTKGTGMCVINTALQSAAEVKCRCLPWNVGRNDEQRCQWTLSSHGESSFRRHEFATAVAFWLHQNKMAARVYIPMWQLDKFDICCFKSFIKKHRTPIFFLQVAL